MSQNGEILESSVVVPNKFVRRTCDRMYGPQLLEKTILENIFYCSDDLRVNGYVARPSEPGIYPVLIWNRGGWGERGSLDDLTALLILASTAEWGYVVLGTNYRGNKGGEGQEDWGGEDVNDAYNLLEVARHYPEADLSRIAVEGASRGGITTYQLLQRDTRWRCAIVHAGISDVFALRDAKEEFAKFTRKLFGHLLSEQQEIEMRNRSGAYNVEKFPRTCPILLMHGTYDHTVPIDQSERMAAALGRAAIPYRYVPLKDATHVALKDGSYRRIDEIRRDWLETHLR